MKRVIMLLISIMLMSQLLGCFIKKSDSDIRKIAYNYLSDEEKDTIKDWEAASVENTKDTSKHVVMKNSKLVDIQNINTYKVTFNTEYDGLLGPIVVYMKHKSCKVLGVDLRY